MRDFPDQWHLEGEVHDESRIGEAPGFISEHFAGDNLAGMADRFVGFADVVKHLFELERDALTHDAGAVHRVHEGFSLGFQDVACGDLNHFVPNLVVAPFPPNLHKRVMACGMLLKGCTDSIPQFLVDDRDGFYQPDPATGPILVFMLIG